ncbi:MAG: hypothetical protein Q9180_007238, partial [Flavoplaca navasiana]
MLYSSPKDLEAIMNLFLHKSFASEVKAVRAENAENKRVNALILKSLAPLEEDRSPKRQPTLELEAGDSLFSMSSSHPFVLPLTTTVNEEDNDLFGPGGLSPSLEGDEITVLKALSPKQSPVVPFDTTRRPTPLFDSGDWPMFQKSSPGKSRA